jgi:hypothetical protein
VSSELHQVELSLGQFFAAPIVIAVAFKATAFGVKRFGSGLLVALAA